jgi:hypothetical protein
MKSTQSTLNLVIDHQVKEGIKAYATRNRRTISDIVENIFAALIDLKKPYAAPDTEVAPFIRALHTATPLPGNMNDKEELAEMLMKKHE